MTTLESLFGALVDTSCRASCLILVVLSLRYLASGHIAAGLLFYVWVAVAFRLLLPISIPAAWSPFNLASWVHLFDDRPSVRPLPETITAATGSRAVPSNQVVVPKGAFSSLANLSQGEWTALIWISGATALLFARIFAYVRFARKLNGSAVLPSGFAASLPQEILSGVGARGVEILITGAVHGPALHGIFRPRILFPPGFLERLSPSEIRLTIAHELAHAERRDILADTIIHMAVVVHWFNPLVWLAARTARQDCELACDEFVLSRLTEGDSESYGLTLLAVAKLTTEERTPGFTMGVISSKGQIKRRIEMIIANKSFTRLGTLLGAAVSAAIIASSFTSELTAQISTPELAPGAPAQVTAAPNAGPANIVYDASIDRLDVLFPNGIVATVGDHNISVTDVRQYIAPLIPKLQKSVKDQEDFNGKLTLLQNSAIKDLVTRTLLIKQFHDQKNGEQPKQIAPEYVDTSIADMVKERFDGDRSKFLAHLRDRNLSMSEYRKEVEEDIIYNYMRGQERKMAGKTDQTKPAPEERPIRLRIIQLSRADGETDAALLEKANGILARLQNGETFDFLARQFDQSGRRDRGGDWGWMGPADVRTEYRDAAMTLKKGEVSAPIFAKEGCFLFYAEDRR